MADIVNSQAESHTGQDTGKKNYMMFDPSSMLPDSENATHTMKTAGAEYPDLITSPSRTPPGSPTFYLAPSIVQAMQHIPPAEPSSPKDFRHSAEPLDLDIDTVLSNLMAKLIATEETMEPSPNKTFTSGVSHQAPQQDPAYATRPHLGVQEQSSRSNEQDAPEQQKGKEADTQKVEEGVSQVGSSESDSRNMKNMLAIKKFQLSKKHLELELTQESNTKLRTRLFNAQEELAEAQEKLKQKDSYISARDKKIDVLQKTLVLLTGSTAEQVHTGMERDCKSGSQPHNFTSNPKKIPIPPSQPFARTKSITRSSEASHVLTPMDAKALSARETEARIDEAQSDYEPLLEEKEALISQITKRSYERRAQREDRYMLGALSEKLRRLVEEVIWENRELDMENDRLREDNEKLREEVNKAKDTKNSRISHVCIPQQTSEDTVATVSQHEDSKKGTSAVEAEQVKDAVSDGHESIDQRVNSPLSQGSPCGSDWASVEESDVEKDWPYAWW